MFSLPESIQNARKAYVGRSQYSTKTPKVPASPPKYTKSHLARPHSSSPVSDAQNELNTSGPPSSPPEKSELARLRSDTLGKGLTATSPTSESPPPKPREGWAGDYLPAGFKVLPKSCYNYEPFQPPPPPPVLPCSRAWLYSQIVSTSRLVFLSCHLTNPIHLASVIAFGQKWSVTEEIASIMTPAMNIEWLEDLGAWKGMYGVLVCRLTPHAIDLLEAVRHIEDGYERTVEDVAVQVEDDAMTVAAYVYQKSPGRMP
ncbi:hypothetical protein E8E11_011274 [Didymella keratinophila]|nr:hypothetical protein E8E11_011274 [Didymella keratinophila]